MKERILSCIIVEDEPLAAEILQDYVASLPNFRLVAHCTNAMLALEVLKNHHIDLIFLDIHLPRLTGFDFLSALPHQPQVIITSGYHEYVLQSFEYNVADYLLKPIAFSRFLKSVNKVIKNIQLSNTRPLTEQQIIERKYLFFDVGRKQVKVFLDEIHYVESCREYVKVYYEDKFLLTRIKISDMEQALLADTFVRIHRSYIVNFNKIKLCSHDEIEIDRTALPVSRPYKQQLQHKLHISKESSLMHRDSRTISTLEN